MTCGRVHAWPRTSECDRSGGPMDGAVDAAALQVLISRLTGDRRGDGGGAAARRVQPEHQGAGRLLGRAVHRRRRAARAGRAHPGAPRVDAGRRCGPRSTRAATRSGPATRSSSTTRTRAARTSTTSRWSRRASSTVASSGWAANRAHHADLGGMAPGSMPPDAVHIAQEGLRIPPVRALRRGRGRDGRVVADARTSGGATSTPRSARTVSAWRRLAELAGEPFDADRRLRRASDARRAAALPDGRWRAEDVLDSTGPRAGAATSGPDRARARDRRRRP